ncbi:MAG: aminotransferase class I/II-fold pyridoxal phosphate-dependent enzyme, partial [Phaeodactylibacter sp.]|nr:aminotransferase class I/II-fold pyridoxal phosphate-dependent enzyme [Phaeodactylibacter sp.]
MPINSKILEELIQPHLLRLKPYSSARSEYEGQASVFLDANEHPIDSGLNRYPDPLQKALKRELALQKGVRPEQVFLGNGSDEAIDLLIRLFCRPGIDEIVILPPTYGMYQVAATISNVRVREVLLGPDFQPDPAEILA